MICALRSLRLILLIYNKYAKNIPAFVLEMGHFGLFALTALLTGNYLVWKLSGQGVEIYCRLEKMPFLAQKTTRLRQLDRRLLMSAGSLMLPTLCITVTAELIRAFGVMGGLNVIGAGIGERTLYRKIKEY